MKRKKRNEKKWKITFERSSSSCIFSFVYKITYSTSEKGVVAGDPVSKKQKLIGGLPMKFKQYSKILDLIDL